MDRITSHGWISALDAPCIFVQKQIGIIESSPGTEEETRQVAKDKLKGEPSIAAAGRAGQRRGLQRGLIAGQEEERRRLARELHDGLNQKLVVLAIELSELSQNEEVPDAVRDRLKKLEGRVGSIVDEVRRMSHRLHPTIVDNLGLKAALEGLCEEVSQATGISIRFEPNDVPESISNSVSLALFRMAQEALQNMAKHSKASEACVSLTGSRTSVRLTVTDEGRGCSPESFANKLGLGIRSMTERIEAVDGILAFEGRPGAGVRVVAEVPLVPPASAAKKSHRPRS